MITTFESALVENSNIRRSWKFHGIPRKTTSGNLPPVPVAECDWKQVRRVGKDYGLRWQSVAATPLSNGQDA